MTNRSKVFSVQEVGNIAVYKKFLDNNIELVLNYSACTIKKLHSTSCILEFLNK